MASALRTAFRDSTIFHWYKNVAAPIDYAWWRFWGTSKPKVPHLVKQMAIREYGRKFNLDTLVETGTNYGHMIYAQRNHFRKIYSIELDKPRAESARRKFAGRPNIRVILGDSGVEFPKLAATLTGPCLFWLDGHEFDISTPVKLEIAALCKYPVQDHVILVDDAHWFDGRGDYPTLEQVREQMAGAYPQHVMEVKDDILRFYKPKSGTAG
ncbi:MAG: hypothetical protein WAL51_07265 [Candidatus Acidiferrales bacterium]